MPPAVTSLKYASAFLSLCSLYPSANNTVIVLACCSVKPFVLSNSFFLAIAVFPSNLSAVPPWFALSGNFAASASAGVDCFLPARFFGILELADSFAPSTFSAPLEVILLTDCILGLPFDSVLDSSIAALACRFSLIAVAASLDIVYEYGLSSAPVDSINLIEIATSIIFGNHPLSPSVSQFDSSGIEYVNESINPRLLLYISPILNSIIGAVANCAPIVGYVI